MKFPLHWNSVNKMKLDRAGFVWRKYSNTTFHDVFSMTDRLGEALLNNISLFAFIFTSAALACSFRGVVYTDHALAWERPGIGQMALYMFLEAVVLFILVLLIEVRL